MGVFEELRKKYRKEEIEKETFLSHSLISRFLEKENCFSQSGKDALSIPSQGKSRSLSKHNTIVE